MDLVSYKSTDGCTILLNPNLLFNGQHKAAFTFYEQCWIRTLLLQTREERAAMGKRVKPLEYIGCEETGNARQEFSNA
jgi:hypothetical protein